MSKVNRIPPHAQRIPDSQYFPFLNWLLNNHDRGAEARQLIMSGQVNNLKTLVDELDKFDAKTSWSTAEEKQAMRQAINDIVKLIPVPDVIQDRKK